MKWDDHVLICPRLPQQDCLPSEPHVWSCFGLGRPARCLQSISRRRPVTLARCGRLARPPGFRSARGAVEPDLGTAIDIDLLAAMLGLSQALTAKTTHGGVDFYYRSVASAGALYPSELYVGVSSVQGLAGGCYHHSVARQALTQLRCGDITDYLVRGVNLGNQPTPAVSFFPHDNILPKLVEVS